MSLLLESYKILPNFDKMYSLKLINRWKPYPVKAISFSYEKSGELGQIWRFEMLILQSKAKVASSGIVRQCRHQSQMRWWFRLSIGQPNLLLDNTPHSPLKRRHRSLKKIVEKIFK